MVDDSKAGKCALRPHPLPPSPLHPVGRAGGGWSHLSAAPTLVGGVRPGDRGGVCTQLTLPCLAVINPDTPSNPHSFPDPARRAAPLPSPPSTLFLPPPSCPTIHPRSWFGGRGLAPPAGRTTHGTLPTSTTLSSWPPRSAAVWPCGWGMRWAGRRAPWLGGAVSLPPPHSPIQGGR